MTNDPERQRFETAMGVKTVTRHYHVGSNVPGYLPESDTYTVGTKRDAVAALTEEVRRYRDQELDLPRRERRTARGAALDGQVYFSRPGDTYDLGISFWWIVCQETDCSEDGEY